ncbi:Uncharacterized protein PECH_004791 [Penicillium ucsense]|uniref:CMP/dCMP-type deaminase domain-containing protein n=1 Tax=Penicillium ucsense TaxID=2839758 RepID=A0A8J8W721_9EURO|nr:Uncharacterized protein PECM_007573 [Penicillium ucsense]KAF7739311.1 Uncharacterized protein PECH_004791 [Penicillium ucsense]
MHAAEIIKAIEPLKGSVVAIKTVQETRPLEDFADAFIAEINVKSASKVIKALDSAFPRDESLPMSHLRRFAKRNMIPQELLAAIEAVSPPDLHDGQTLFVMLPPPLPDAEALRKLLAQFAPQPRRRNSTTPPRPDPATSQPEAAPSDSPSAAQASTSSTSPEPQIPQISLVTTRVPIYPPFNISQADQWTKTMWPVVFNPAAPRSNVAPPPQILSRTREAIEPRAGHFLALARKVAEEAHTSGRGRAVGAVVVDPAIESELESIAWDKDSDPTEHWMDAVVAVAGDVRYARLEAAHKFNETNQTLGDETSQTTSGYNPDIEGGPDLHALMRAAEFIARRRRQEDEELAETPEPALPVVLTDPQLSNQLSPLESYFLNETSRLTLGPEPDQWPTSNLSPKKRKHGDSGAGWADEPQVSSCSTAPSTAPSGEKNPSARTEDGSCSAVDCNGDGPSSPGSRIRTRSEGGYLCTGLDIYLTHEPCVCCSMGILLSRFRAVIYPRTGRLPSGGIASEPIVRPTRDEHAPKEGEHQGEHREYYGLHWRKELNWRALGYEFVETELNEAGEGATALTKDGSQEDVIFHA